MVITMSAQVKPSYKMPQHPRLFLLKGEEKQLLKDIESDLLWNAIHKAMLWRANSSLNVPLLTRKMEGKRLLSVSRNAFSRLLLWGYAYRTTGEKKYAERMEKELVNVCEFYDWNPSHFLDVAEMLMAVSIGYDWLYDELSAETKGKIESAVMQKGLLPSEVKPYGNFVTRANNWNQVCEAGIVCGSIAIWETDRDKCAFMVNRAVENVPIAMRQYAPNGAYPEGCGYWGYGTSFNVLMLSALEKAFGKDFKLTKMPGFLESGEFITHMTSPALSYFNYSDGGTATACSPALFWFYGKCKDESLLFNQFQIVKSKGLNSVVVNQLGPMSIIWGHKYRLVSSKEPQQRYWIGGGVNPVCTMRGGWGTEDAFIGIKLGSPSASHAHMDVGNFVFDNDGVRWAMDIGADNYNNLEQAGVDLWNGKQNGQRWDMFRYNNYNHNTLTFANQYQRVKGYVDFAETCFRGSHWFAKADLTPVYQGQILKAERAFSLMNGKWCVVEDCIENLDKSTPLKWTLMTATKPVKLSDNIIELTYGTKKCYVKFDATVPFVIKIEDCKPANAFENQNIGLSAIRLYADLLPKSKTHIKVFLTPENHEYNYNELLGR